MDVKILQAQIAEGCEAAINASRAQAARLFQPLAEAVFQEHPTLVSFGWEMFRRYNDETYAYYVEIEPEQILCNGISSSQIEDDADESNESDAERNAKQKRWDKQWSGVTKQVSSVLGVLKRTQYHQLFGEGVAVSFSREGATFTEIENEDGDYGY